MNPLAGEKLVEIQGKRYVLRPCFEAFALMEELAGAGPIEMYDRFNEGKSRIKDVVAVLYACALHGNNRGFDLDHAEFGKLVYEHGFWGLAKPAFQCVVEALVKGQKKTVEEDPSAPATPTEASAGDPSSIKP